MTTETTLNLEKNLTPEQARATYDFLHSLIRARIQACGQDGYDRLFARCEHWRRIYPTLYAKADESIDLGFVEDYLAIPLQDRAKVRVPSDINCRAVLR